jgi:broad-specificity NMP kinase
MESSGETVGDPLHPHEKSLTHPRSRDYPLKKIQENNEAEILQTVLDEARESYAEEIIVELRSETVEDMESNVSRIVQWIENWKRDHPASYFAWNQL